MEVEAGADVEAEAEALIRFSWKQLLLPCKYFEALSREMELISLIFWRNGVNFLDILELDLEGCFENHDCRIWSKKFNP